MANTAKIQKFPANTGTANKSVMLNDVRIEMDAEGAVVVFTDRHVEVRSPINTGVVEIFKGAPLPGSRMPDGTIYVGATADGSARIFAMPEDLEGTMTSNNARRAVESLNAQNAFGHNDWQIPSIEVAKVMTKSMGKGALAGTFSETTVVRVVAA